VLGRNVCCAKNKGKNTKKHDGNNQQGKRKRGQSNKKLNGNHDKKEKKLEDWLKKRSIFFMLPYWEHNKLRHNLDVMHIERNVFENLIATLLDIEFKTKDGLQVRLDLVELGIRQKHHPVVDDQGK